MVGIGNLFPFEVTSHPADSKRLESVVYPTPASGEPDAHRKERSRICRKALDYIRVNPLPQYDGARRPFRCPLPPRLPPPPSCWTRMPCSTGSCFATRPATPGPPASPPVPRDGRSEERRVGEECRSRWSPDH